MRVLFQGATERRDLSEALEWPRPRRPTRPTGRPAFAVSVRDPAQPRDAGGVPRFRIGRRFLHGTRSIKLRCCRLRTFPTVGREALRRICGGGDMPRRLGPSGGRLSSIETGGRTDGPAHPSGPSGLPTVRVSGCPCDGRLVPCGATVGDAGSTGARSPSGCAGAYRTCPTDDRENSRPPLMIGRHMPQSLMR